MRRFDASSTNVLAAACCLAATSFVVSGGTAAYAQQAAAPSTSARLVVDYGDGVEVHFTALPWRDGLTVLDLLEAARTHRHGITFEQRGRGSSTMITKIGDLSNQAGGQEGKNWIFSINGKMAQEGAGVAKVAAGDAILWRFQAYDYNAN